MEISFIYTLHGLQPFDPETIEYVGKLKLGDIVMGKLVRPRNYRFLKKYFAMLRLTFDQWKPGKLSKEYGTPLKSFTHFRKDVIKLAGYYHTVFRLDGSFTVEADSISFGKMTEEEFELLYNRSLDVVVQRVWGDMTNEEVNDLVEKVLSFA